MEFLIDNMNSNNEINLSQREVEQATGISIKTINETFKALVTANFLKKIKRRYVLNTQIISAFGSGDKNRMLCVEYGFDSNFKQSETMEEKLLKIQAQQEQLKRDEAFLKKILENKAS